MGSARPPAGVCNPNPQLSCHRAPDPLLLCVPCPPGAGKQGAAPPAPHCGWGASPDTSPVVHCSGDLPGSTLPKILRTLPRHGCRQGVLMLRAHPLLWGLRVCVFQKPTTWREAGRLQDVGAQMGVPGEAGSPRAAMASQAGPLLRPGLCLQDAHRLRAAFFPVLKMPPDEGRLVSPGRCAPTLVFLPNSAHVLNVVTRALVSVYRVRVLSSLQWPVGQGTCPCPVSWSLQGRLA